MDEAKKSGTLSGDIIQCTMGKNKLNSNISERELMYPPDPGKKTATLGGNVMTNAGGMRAVKYGVTRDYVRGMEVVLPNGEILELGGQVSGEHGTGHAKVGFLRESLGDTYIEIMKSIKNTFDPRNIVSLGNQTGEGWFLSGEMIELIESGVPNIVCMQPFACLTT